MADDIEIEAGYPVPVRYAGRPGAGERLAFDPRRARVTLRSVPMGAMRPVRAEWGGRSVEGFRHDGRLWRVMRVFAPHDRPLDDPYGTRGFETPPATLAQAVSILGAGNAPDLGAPMHIGGALHGTGSPVCGQDPVPPGKASLPRALARSVEDLGPAALVRLRAFFEGDVRHDGAAVYVAAPNPLAFGLSGGRAGGGWLDVAVPDWNLGWRGPGGDLGAPGPYGAFLDAVGAPGERADLDALARAMEPLGLDPAPGTAARCFLLEAPAYLRRVHRGLARREDAAGGPEAAALAARRLDALAPIAARAAIGILDDPAAAADAVHRAAAALHALDPGDGARFRFVEAMRYVEAMVWPAQGQASGDLESLAGLGPA